MSLHVIGVDPSLTGCGVAHLTTDGLVQTWVKGTDPIPRDAPIAATSERLATIVRWLFDRELNKVNANTCLAVVEGPIEATHGGAANGKPIERHWLFGRIIDGFVRYQIPVVSMNPTWPKSYLCGHGRAGKGAMKRAVVACWPKQGLQRIDDNEADAVALAAMGADWLGWPGPWLEGRRGAGWLRKARWPERDAVTA